MIVILSIYEIQEPCMKQMTDPNALQMFQWELTRGAQMQEQQKMFEKQNQFNQLSLPY